MEYSKIIIGSLMLSLALGDFIFPSLPEATEAALLECKRNSDCSYDDQCYRNLCVNACKLRMLGVEISGCGINTDCVTWWPHTAVCQCKPYYTGNPDMGCIKVDDEEYYNEQSQWETEYENFEGKDNYI